MKVIVVRHGETSYNRIGRLMGHLNIGLNQLGKQQAQKLADRIAQEKLDFIYSSDLDRAKQTLDAVRAKHPQVPVHFDQQLRERNIGIFSGKLRTEIDWDSLPGNQLTRKPPQGESLTDMKGRVNRFLKHLRDKHLGETVLLVTHGGTMRIIHHLLTRESLIDSFTEYSFMHTGVCIYDLSEQKPKIICFNDTSHL